MPAGYPLVTRAATISRGRDQASGSLSTRGDRRDQLSPWQAVADGVARRPRRGARGPVSKPIVYEHFGGKEGLYAVVVDREVQPLLATMRSTLDRRRPARRCWSRRRSRCSTTSRRTGRLPDPGPRLPDRHDGPASSRSSATSPRASRASCVDTFKRTRPRRRRPRRCTRRCWSAWSPPSASGGSTPASRPGARVAAAPGQPRVERLAGPDQAEQRASGTSPQRRAEQLDPVAVAVEGVEAARGPGSVSRWLQSTSKPSAASRAPAPRARDVVDAPAPGAPCGPGGTGPRPRRGSRRRAARRRRNQAPPRAREVGGLLDLGHARARRRRTAGRRPRRRAGRRPGRGGASCAPPARPTKTRRNGSTTPYSRSRVGRAQPALELRLELAAAGRRAAPAASGRAPVPETQVKTGSVAGQHVQVRRLPGVDRRSRAAASASR